MTAPAGRVRDRPRSRQPVNPSDPNTKYYDTGISVVNPNAAPVNVTVTYFGAKGAAECVGQQFPHGPFEIAANSSAVFYQGPADFRFPGGETGREVQARVVKVVEALLERSHDGPAVLVAHADPLRALIAHYLGLDANNYYRLRIDCGSISRLSLYPPGSSRRVPLAQLDVLNLTEHLRL